jgi:hypothetical protein
VSQHASTDPELASEFTPGLTAVKLRIVKVHKRAKAHHSAGTSSTSTSNTLETPVLNTPGATETPTYAAPVYTSPPSHHSSPSGEGSGTTSVGGSSSKKHSGTGSTSVG